MSYAVDFVQAETQLFSGGPCHALWCEPQHYVQIRQLPNKTSIQESVPSTFKNLYPDTRVIIAILRRLRLTALTSRYSVSDVGQLQASNFQELHHLSIDKCIAISQ